MPPEVPTPPVGVPAQHTQIGITNLPPAAWTKLTGQQLENVLLRALDLAKAQDDRRFQITKDELAVRHRIRVWTLCVGALVASMGMGAVVYLSSTGHETTAGVIGGALVALVAVFLGKKAL